MKVKFAYTTIAQKLVTGLSGLLLCGFLITHLGGNFLLYLPGVPEDPYKPYNDYAHALHANPLLPVAEIMLLVLFLAHIVLALVLVFRNRQARPDRYAVKRSKRQKSWLTPHNVMHVTGIIVLGFIVLHILDFRLGMRLPGPEGEDPASRAIRVLHDPISASVYVLGSLLLGYHLAHGFVSGFQTLGANHPRFTPLIKRIGIAFAILVGVGFASFPILINMGFGK